MIRFLVIFTTLVCMTNQLNASIWDFFTSMLFSGKEETACEDPHVSIRLSQEVELADAQEELEEMAHEPIAVKISSISEPNSFNTPAETCVVTEPLAQELQFIDEPLEPQSSNSVFSHKQEEEKLESAFESNDARVCPQSIETNSAVLSEEVKPKVEVAQSSMSMSKLNPEKRWVIEKGETFCKMNDLPLFVEIQNEGHLHVDASGSRSFKGHFLGKGSLSIEGGELAMDEVQNLEGSIFLKQSHLILNGQVHDVMVLEGSTLSGNGQIHHLRNAGRVSPGNSIGVLTVNGDYIQEPSGLLTIELNAAGENDQVLIKGQATLAGNLKILPSTGVYRANLRYPFLSAHLVQGQFDQILNPYPNLFTIRYGLRGVEFLTSISATLLPIEMQNLRGNSRRVADYLFGNSFIAPEGDLSDALQMLTSMDPIHFENALIKWSPLIYGSLPKLDLQNDTRMARLMGHQFRQICSCSLKKPAEKRRWLRRAKGKRYYKNRHRKYCVPDRTQGVWAEPIGFYYRQKQTQGELSNEGQPAFDAYTYGVGLGYSRLIGKCWALQGGVGYTHSNLFWRNDLGDGGVSSLYLAPSVGYFKKDFYANFLFQSSFNFYKVYRRIHFGTFNRETRALFTFYDYLFQVEAARTFQFKPKWFLRPEGQFSYLYLSSGLFTEKGGGSLALKIDKQKVSYFQPHVLIRLIREFWLKKGCLSPNIYVGWLANIPLGEKRIQAKFDKEQTHRTRFQVLTYQETTNQMIVGINMAFQSYQHLTLSAGYEANFLSRYQIYQMNFRLQWDF